MGAGVQRSLHFPGSRPGYAYSSSSSGSSGYSQQGEGSAGPRVTDYEMGEARNPYHQYYPDTDPAAPAPVVPRRYQDRLWWPPVPLPVLGAHTDSYLPRSISADAPQQAHQGIPQRQMERSLGRGEIEGSGRGQHMVGGDRHLPHDTHIINMVRGVPGQEGGGLGQEYHEAWPPPPSTTPTPDPHTRHNTPYNSQISLRSRASRGFTSSNEIPDRQTSVFDSSSNHKSRQSKELDAQVDVDAQNKPSDGFDSLLQMMTKGEQKEGQSINIETPDRRGGAGKRGGSGRGKGEETPVLARVGPSTRPSTPVTPTILLGSIMLLIILVVVSHSVN